jgi:osmotically-inducible protein OsmY
MDVRGALLRNPATNVEDVDVEVYRGTVRLSGTVHSWQKKHFVETLVKGVRGVRRVVNELSVSAENRRKESEIRSEIEQVLRWDVRVAHALIDVCVSRGQVKLSGAVRSLVEKERAEANAWVQGVKRVDASALKVEEGPRDERYRRGKYILVPDKDIRRAVKDSFRYDPRMDSFLPEVTVKDGTVTLQGTVGTLQARQAAEEDARNVVGVARVDNLIQVTRLELESDEEVTAKIERLLKDDPYLQGYDFEVRTYAGEVHLRGQVSTLFEKNRATQLAGQVRGAVDVDNYVGIEKEEDKLPPKPDWKIEEDIAYEFYWSPLIDGKRIVVTVDEGVATLKGTVSSRAERHAAEANAREAGAVGIVNELKIEIPVAEEPLP